MKKLIATIAITAIFLSAGAFAGIGHNRPAARNAAANITVIHKNQSWSILDTLSAEARGLDV